MTSGLVQMFSQPVCILIMCSPIQPSSFALFCSEVLLCFLKKTRGSLCAKLTRGQRQVLCNLPWVCLVISWQQTDMFGARVGGEGLQSCGYADQVLQCNFAAHFSTNCSDSDHFLSDDKPPQLHLAETHTVLDNDKTFLFFCLLRIILLC